MRLGLDAGEYTLDLAVRSRGSKVCLFRRINWSKDGVDATLAPLRAHGFAGLPDRRVGYNPLSVDRSGPGAPKTDDGAGHPSGADRPAALNCYCGGNYHPSGFAAGDARNFTDQALDELARLYPATTLAEQYGVNISIEPYLKTAIYSPERFLPSRSG